MGTALGLGVRGVTGILGVAGAPPGGSDLGVMGGSGVRTEVETGAGVGTAATEEEEEERGGAGGSCQETWRGDPGGKK